MWEAHRTTPDIQFQSAIRDNLGRFSSRSISPLRDEEPAEELDGPGLSSGLCVNGGLWASTTGTKRNRFPTNSTRTVSDSAMAITSNFILKRVLSEVVVQRASEITTPSPRGLGTLKSSGSPFSKSISPTFSSLYASGSLPKSTEEKKVYKKLTEEEEEMPSQPS